MATVLNRAGNLCWKGMRTIARLMDGVYEKGVKVCDCDKTTLELRRERSTDLNWWNITIILKQRSGLLPTRRSVSRRL